MKTMFRIVLALTLATVPLMVSAGEGEDTEGKVVFGGWGANTSESQDMVSEYQPTDGSAVVGLFLKSHGEVGAFEIQSLYRHEDDTDLEVDFDIKRMVRSHTSYSTLLHRFGHDPMHNLEGASFNGKAVRHSDLDPDQEYGLQYRVLDHWTEFQFPQLSVLTLGVGYREQKRSGHMQAYTNNHCDNCHIVSRSHPIREKTTDGTLSADVAWKGGSLTASATSRRLRQDYSSVTHLYDDALHPEKQKPLFDNRLQYDSKEGPMAADFWPDIDKDIMKLNIALANVGGFVVNGGAVWTQTENRYTGLKSDYNGYILNAAKRWKSGWGLRWRGQVYAIDNDNVFVDTNERVTPAGPHAGQTYEDIYGVNFDHWRYSAMNRDVFQSKTELAKRFGGKAGTLKFQWDYQNIDREHYEVLPGEKKTTKNLVGVSWRTRPAKGWKINANLRHADVTNAFTLINGACSTLESPRYTVPWFPETPQYHDQHDTRIAETTASASSWDELKLSASYVTGKTTVTGTYRYFDGSNTDGNLTDWSRNNNSATLTVWSAPAQTWDWYLGYALTDSKIDSPVCIPIFDG
ncbi:MAG: hypothetical protein GY906_08010 [bacterium]|nr:hypothetical protein [bacterium]